MLNGLDLFSGIGGLTKGLGQWVHPVAYCENDSYCQRVLLSRMECGDLPRAPIWDDVSTLRALALPKLVDIIIGGFPCQDISVAGAGKGLEGERSGLFNEIIRLTSEINPSFVFLENVPAIRTRGLRQVIGAFTDLRYDCRWTSVSAAEVGAVHIRKRWFLLAHTNSVRLREEQWAKLERSKQVERPMESNSKGSPRSSALPCPGAVKSVMVGDGDGISNIVDRNRALGNSVVPAQARKAFEKLMGGAL